jgi:hypothetical protein
VVNILKVVASCSSDVFEGRHLLEVDALRFLSLLPKAEIVDVLLESLAVLDWRRLSLPTFLAEIFTFGHIQCSSQPTVQVLNDAEILLLNSRGNLEHRAPTELGVGQSMERIDDTTCGHDLSILQFRVFSDVSCYSQCDRSQDRAACATEESLFARSDCWVGVHQLIRIHKGVHGIGRRHSHSSCSQDASGDLLSEGRVGRQLDKDRSSVLASDPLNNFLDNLRHIGAGSSHTFVGHAMVAGQVELENIKVGLLGEFS